MNELCALDFKIFLSRVSSVLNKDNKNYGKKNLIDGSEETCWNSEAVKRSYALIFTCVSIEKVNFRVHHSGYRLHQQKRLLCKVLQLNFKEVLQRSDFFLNLDMMMERGHRLLNSILMIMANYKYPFFSLFIFHRF